MPVACSRLVIIALMQLLIDRSDSQVAIDRMNPVLERRDLQVQPLDLLSEASALASVEVTRLKARTGLAACRRDGQIRVLATCAGNNDACSPVAARFGDQVRRIDDKPQRLGVQACRPRAL